MHITERIEPETCDAILLTEFAILQQLSLLASSCLSFLTKTDFAFVHDEVWNDMFAHAWFSREVVELELVADGWHGMMAAGCLDERLAYCRLFGLRLGW
jgi:hypothetical protein